MHHLDILRLTESQIPRALKASGAPARQCRQTPAHQYDDRLVGEYHRARRECLSWITLLHPASVSPRSTAASMVGILIRLTSANASQQSWRSCRVASAMSRTLVRLASCRLRVPESSRKCFLRQLCRADPPFFLAYCAHIVVNNLCQRILQLIFEIESSDAVPCHHQFVPIDPG